MTTASPSETPSFSQSPNEPITVLVSEFYPELQSSAGVEFELKGSPGVSFSGWIVSISSGNNDGGLVHLAEQMSGVFDSIGIYSTKYYTNYIELPSTVIVCSEFRTALGDELDRDNDNVLDDLSIFGTEYDAIGVPRPSVDESYLYESSMNGADMKYSGTDKRLVFRNSQNNDLYAYLNIGDVVDEEGEAVDLKYFDIAPWPATFGSVNPKFVVT